MSQWSAPVLMTVLAAVAFAVFLLNLPGVAKELSHVRIARTPIEHQARRIDFAASACFGVQNPENRYASARSG